MYLLDTNTVIDLFQDRGRVAERLLGLPPPEIALSAVVLYELEVGVRRSTRPEANRRQLDELTRLTTSLPFGAEEARAAGRIRAELEGRGEVIGPYDILIAATAQANGAILVTRNEKEFGKVDGLRLENWY